MNGTRLMYSRMSLGNRVRSPKLAFSLFPFYITRQGPRPDLAPPLAELLARVSAVGYAGVPAEVPEGMAEADYLALLKQYNLEPAPGYFHADFGDISNLSAVVQAARVVARSHARLGLSRIFVAARFPESKRMAAPARGAGADAAWLGAAIEGLRQVSVAMVEEGIHPCLHPHVATAIETETEAEAVLAAIGPELLLVGPDVGHLAWAGTDPVAFIRRHRHRLGALHIKDMHSAVAAEGRSKELSHNEIIWRNLWATPGNGDLDCEGVLDLLGDFQGWIVAEIDIADAPTVDEVAQKAYNWIAPRLGGRSRAELVK